MEKYIYHSTAANRGPCDPHPCKGLVHVYNPRTGREGDGDQRTTGRKDEPTYSPRAQHYTCSSVLYFALCACPSLMHSFTHSLTHATPSPPSSYHTLRTFCVFFCPETAMYLISSPLPPTSPLVPHRPARWRSKAEIKSRL